VIRLAGEPPVLACLGSALAAALLLSPRLSRLARQREEAERRARTGLTLVEAIALAIEAKDSTSERHLRRMRIYAVGVARRLGMLPHEVEALEYAALLHDVGKLVVPETILTKPVSLSEKEFERMAAHARVGAEILETTPLSSQVAEMVRHHHERYDGTGYPAGLTGVEIPIGSRILSAVDCFEALTSERPYRHGMPVREAIDYLRRNSGVLFDPRVVRTLLDAHAELEQEVLEEERARAAVRPHPGAAVQRAGGGAAKEGRQPVQNVLDGIATSHMDVYSLHQISQALGKTLDLEECFALIAGRLRRLIHFESAAIYVMDSENDVLRPRYATGAGSAEILGLTIPMGQALSGWAARQKHSLIGVAADPAVGPSRRDASRSDLEPLAGSAELARLRSSLVAPLLEGQTLVGVIALYDRAERGYTTQEERLLSQMAGQVAGAIRAGLLFEQTQEHALTDSLTGLPNSRYMSIAFEREAARAREQGAPLTLMVMDIDNFRGINDDFGHQAGDRFLIGMARAIRSQMRVCDSCIRHSGDEFVAILPGLAGLEVEAVAERLMEVARDYCLETRPGRPAGTSLSIGWATMPEDGEQFAALLDRAAGRMRENKQRRRNGLDEGCSPRPADHLMKGTRH
ncbi:MAG TPA: HD domain-containing phosphohydrolase, partial [Candidatus Polarisedimenticolia bacterium]|nr:HD domain-containing phosphohydrolase [Candidatus Polarisedimenticolia bacterium]